MSIAINTDRVAEVLLADGWHIVTDDSFDLDAYEYYQGELDGHHLWTLRAGQVPLIPSAGFSFMDITGARVSGPLTAVLAVREKVAE